jgi:hypothetical protein
LLSSVPYGLQGLTFLLILFIFVPGFMSTYLLMAFVDFPSDAALTWSTSIQSVITIL